MGDCPSFNLSFNYTMFTVPILVSFICLTWEKKVVLGIMSSLSFLVFIPFGFLLALTSTILNTYFCPFVLNDMDYIYQSPPFFLSMESSLFLPLQVLSLHLSISKLQPRSGTTTYFYLSECPIMKSTLISLNFSLSME